MNNVVTHLEWNDFFLRLKEYGNQFINNDRAKILSEKTGDGHTIIYRQLDKFPDWMLDGLKIKPVVFQIFAITPESTGMIHRDGLDRKSALNIPLLNCDKGFMDWFENIFDEYKVVSGYTNVRLTTVEKNHSLYRVGVGAHSKAEDAPAHRCLIETPSIVNTDVWHRIDNKLNKNYRYLMSIRFAGNPSFEDVNKIYSLPIIDK